MKINFDLSKTKTGLLNPKFFIEKYHKPIPCKGEYEMCVNKEPDANDVRNLKDKDDHKEQKNNFELPSIQKVSNISSFEDPIDTDGTSNIPIKIDFHEKMNDDLYFSENVFKELDDQEAKYFSTCPVFNKNPGANQSKPAVSKFLIEQSTKVHEKAPDFVNNETEPEVTKMPQIKSRLSYDRCPQPEQNKEPTQSIVTNFFSIMEPPENSKSPDPQPKIGNSMYEEYNEFIFGERKISKQNTNNKVPSSSFMNRPIKENMKPVEEEFIIKNDFKSASEELRIQNIKV